MTLDERTKRALEDIPGFAGEIRLYVISAGEQNFYRARTTTHLVAEALLHRIGEAVSRLGAGFMADHPAIEWHKMKGMRNVVAHQDGFVDYRIVGCALDRALPNDVSAIERILELE